MILEIFHGRRLAAHEQVTVVVHHARLAGLIEHLEAELHQPAIAAGLLDGRASSTSQRKVRRSPGRTGSSQRTSSMPGEPRPADCA